MEVIKEHLTCGLCSGPFAQSLVLTCSHLFCGDCLLKRLQQEGLTSKQTCPTCNMDLRAVPVRCLAMDKIAAAIVPSLPLEQQQQYSKRCRDGQTAADQINKMLWWLTPTHMGGPLGAAGGPSTPTAALHPAAAANMLGGAFGSIGSGMSMAMAANPSILGGLDPKASSGLPASFAALNAAAAAAAHQAPFAPGALPHFGGPLGAGHLAAMQPHLAGAGANPVLQMAMAAHMAQAQEAMRKQLQLNAPAAAAAAAAAAANLHGPAFMQDISSLQHVLLGQERSAAAAAALGGHMGGVPPAQPGGYTADQQLQLSTLMASMCQV